MTNKLFFTPGACSLSPHIALREAGLPFQLVQVDLAAKKTEHGENFLAINPKGYVPALLTDSGELITEGAILVQYIADQRPESGLAPAAGTPERRRLQEWLHFIATELQKGLGPINNPKANDELRQVLKERLNTRFAFLSKSLEDEDYLLGNQFSVADGYAFYVLRGLRKLEGQAAFDQRPVLKAYFERISARPAVKAVLEAEKLS
ncbi:MAG TPA: glutathione transferase GstA [Polyangiaceae bacterium]|jgi:glutathione S-transferase|nr:glutathione transferase GstA [Polyangiaceae bacterium]